MMFAIFMSRVLGQLRDTVIAFQFGQNEQTDAYRAAFQLPDLLYFMVAGGALSSALIPVFSRHLQLKQEEAAWRIFSTVAILMMSVVGVLVVVAEVFAPWLVSVMFSGFDSERLEMTTSLTRIVLPSQIFFLAGGLMMATLYSRNEYLVPALGPNVYNVGIIFGGLALAGPFGIAGLAWGALLGAFVGNVLLPLWAMRRLGSRLNRKIDLKDPGARQVFKMMLPVMFGLSLPGIYMLILRMFGSHLPEGSISALDNANRQMQAPLGIVGQAVGLAIFPVMSRLAAEQDWKTFRLVLRNGLRLVWYLCLPATALLFALADDVGRLFLQYGKFKPSDTELVASALRAFSLGLFAWAGQALVARAFFSLQDGLTPTLIGSIATLAFVPLAWLLMIKMEMGPTGLALAVSIAATMQMVSMLIVLGRRVPASEGSVEPQPLLRHIGICAGASLLIGGGCFFARDTVADWLSDFQPNLASLFILLALGGAGMALYWQATQRLGLSEAQYVRKFLARKGSGQAEGDGRD
ncbi:MAG: murein biosynthesis integral membrane protein MurJ [Armatimonadetes bacterium]|nr:murein biosynthesis integral membrane protein MurJ [Armatimonadota bacterium]